MERSVEGKIIIISGYAGSGKDTFSSEFGKIIGCNNYVSFAERFKGIIQDNLPKYLREKYPDNNDAEILDILKNDDINQKVFGDMNMRDFLKNLLGGAIRSIEKDIHCIYTCKKILDIFEKDPSSNIICTDNRYENEQSYLITINSLNTMESKKDFIRTQISLVCESIRDKKGDFNNIFFDNLIKNNSNITEEQRQFIDRIRYDFSKTIQELNLESAPESKIFLPKWENKGFSDDDFLRLGVIRVFRPVVSESFEVDGKTEDEVIRHMVEYSGTSREESKRLIDNYKDWGLGVKDLKKYGFCRTNPESPSERELVDAGREGYVLINNYKRGIEALIDKAKYISRRIEEISDVKKKREGSLKNHLKIKS